MLKMNREMRGDTEGRENYADRYKRNLKKGKNIAQIADECEETEEIKQLSEDTSNEICKVKA